MNFDLDVSIPALTVFLQGILSFFSPCILPIIPLYMGYLSGGERNEDGSFKQKKILINTLFFIVGVSFAFFLLGISFSAVGQFFTQNQMLFSKIGGIIVILLGFMQLGIFDKPFGGREFKLPFNISKISMNPITALVMGFTFSFAWTPCVGPALSTVLIMVASANSTASGLMLIAVYTLGFTLPFLFVGIFTSACLNFFKKYNKIVSYTVKVGAVLIILMGLMMFTGTMNSITGYLSSFGAVDSTETQEESSDDESDDKNSVAAIDFTLLDQNGNTVSLSDFEGKVIFLNFWATWCSPCVSEMPDIQLLYENYGYNEEDVVILGVALPNDEYSYTNEGSSAYVAEFLGENGYTYPTIMDINGELTASYGISAYPTTFMINANGDVYGYLTGSITYDIMVSIIEQTKE